MAPIARKDPEDNANILYDFEGFLEIEKKKMLEAIEERAHDSTNVEQKLHSCHYVVKLEGRGQ